MGATAASDLAPLLSVLMRTQHRRPATLEEALLSLAAQSCDDFELLLLAHDVSEDGIRELQALVDAYPPSFVDRVRIVPVHGGGRARPLNVGIREALGRYIVILDDDDVALSHWVAEFQKAAALHPTGVLRGLVAQQEVAPVLWHGTTPGYDVVGRPRCPWQQTFDVIEHFTENHSPTGGWAVPRHVFRERSLQFDESLPVLEDWDVLMQAVLTIGVSSIDQIIVLARLWRTGDSSTLLRSEVEWHRARSVVLARLDADSLALPPGSATRLHIMGFQAQEATTRIADLTDELSAARSELQQSEAARRDTEEQLLGERRKIAEIWSSRSWKLSKPLRGVGRLSRRYRRPPPDGS